MNTQQPSLQELFRVTTEKRNAMRQAAAEIRAIRLTEKTKDNKKENQLYQGRMDLRHAWHEYLKAKERHAILERELSGNEYLNSFKQWVEIDALECEIQRIQELPVDSHRDDLSKRKEVKELTAKLHRLIEQEQPKTADTQSEKSASPNTSVETLNWRLLVQQEAARQWKVLEATGANPSIRNIVGDIAKWCRTNGLKTDSGAYPSQNYLRIHVLGGKHWTPPNLRNR